MNIRRAARPLARDGFSLIELLCTLAILVILMVLVTGRGSASAQKRARLGCQGNLQKIFLALTIYRADNRGLAPFLDSAADSETALSQLVPRSTALTEIFICPGSKDKDLAEGEPFANARISYAYYMSGATNDDPASIIVTDRQVNTNAKLIGQPIFSQDGSKPGNNHGKTGGNFLVNDGHVQNTPPLAERDLPLLGKTRLLNPRGPRD